MCVCELWYRLTVKKVGIVNLKMSLNVQQSVCFGLLKEEVAEVQLCCGVTVPHDGVPPHPSAHVNEMWLH